MRIDLSKFKSTLPYASEMFGVYQPIIGWKSRLQNNRLPVTPIPRNPDDIEIGNIDESAKIRALAEAALERGPRGKAPFRTPRAFESVFVFLEQHAIRNMGTDHPQSDSFWLDFFKDQYTSSQIREKFKLVLDSILAFHEGQPLPDSNEFPNREIIRYVRGIQARINDGMKWAEFALNRELLVARYFEQLGKTVEGRRRITSLLLTPNPEDDPLQALLAFDPAALDPIGLRDGLMSPIGFVHLFRQYFFEFDSFLGPPVEHLWVAPFSTVELIESSTRRTLQERILEQSSEAILQNQRSTTDQDELSEAVRQENSRDVKLGSSAEGGVNVLVFHASASVTGAFDDAQKLSRENLHKTLRQQSAKLSSEIRMNFKTTFRTVTETTDVRSKRVLVENKTPTLSNFEVRRKMRQVGVQLQDAGTHLCWQVFVDDPGNELGLAQMVHLASRADLSGHPLTAMLPMPPDLTTRDVPLDIVVPAEGDGRSLTMDVSAGLIGFAQGGLPAAAAAVGAVEVFNHFFGDDDSAKGHSYGIGPTTVIRQPFKVALPDGFELKEVSAPPDDPTFDTHGGSLPVRRLNGNADVVVRVKILSAAEGICEAVISPGSVTVGEVIETVVRIGFTPTAAFKNNILALNAATESRNKENTFERERLIKEDLNKSVRDRIKSAHGIKPRPSNDLREEERTVVYRRLLSQLMKEAWGGNVPRPLAHLRSEMIKALFDVDRMLYFVAPEWWQPRLRNYGLDLDVAHDHRADEQPPGSPPAVQVRLRRMRSRTEAELRRGALGPTDSFGWGGEAREGNYFITEDSEPARMGSSLGWLLQLDGDNLRNAFLNAPWVKAIIPIRPGRERDAFAWLQQMKLEGDEGLDAISSDNTRTVRQVIADTCDKVAIKHEAGLEKVFDADGNGSLPPDFVYEHGFNPLENGIRLDPDNPFEVFDQWIEVVPTDQVVAVVAEFDPVTGLRK